MHEYFSHFWFLQYPSVSAMARTLHKFPGPSFLRGIAAQIPCCILGRSNPPGARDAPDPPRETTGDHLQMSGLRLFNWVVLPELVLVADWLIVSPVLLLFKIVQTYLDIAGMVHG